MRKRGNIAFSVIMPTYNQACFIRRAIRSLFQQTYNYWELIIVNDGSTDETDEYLRDYILDDRIVYIKNKYNEGLGAAINKAMNVAHYNYIAYLPSDDFFFPNHLACIADMFEKNPKAVLVHTSMRWNVEDSAIKINNRLFMGIPCEHCLQLVQTAHKKTMHRWIERKEFISEDLFKTFWYKLAKCGCFIKEPTETCQWTVHPYQRHKIICEKYGGHINKYRSYYNVREAIRYIVSEHIQIDEAKKYGYLKNRKTRKRLELKILIVGDLSYNPERICALEEMGHIIYGLWTRDWGYSFSNVGPLPFGNVREIEFKNWEEEIKLIKPDIIYGMLNSVAVPFCYEVMRKCRNIPFVWHFKEGPFISQVNGTWNKLIALYNESDGQIFINEETKKWYEQFIFPKNMTFVLDGDLPKKDIFNKPFSSKLSENGDIHTVVAGRMVGLTPENIEALSKNNIHVHLYTESYEDAWAGLIKMMMDVAPLHFHVHHHVSQDNWVKEFSQYDAGWLHCFDSNNGGDICLCAWNDLNIPARLSTMMAAGIPTIQKDNSKHMVAMQSCVKSIDCGIFYSNMSNLVCQLKNENRMKELRENVIKHRLKFTFDYHVKELTEFFYRVIKNS